MMLILSADPWLYDARKWFSISINKFLWSLTFINRLETCFPPAVEATAELNLWGRTASEANTISCWRTNWSRRSHLLRISSTNWDSVGYGGRRGIGNWHRHSDSCCLNKCKFYACNKKIRRRDSLRCRHLLSLRFEQLCLSMLVLQHR